MGNVKEHNTKPNWNGGDQNQSFLNANSRSFIQVDKMGILEEVEVGSISTQQEAENIATEHERNNAQDVWTGQWRTTVPGKMTIIQGIKKSAIVRGVQGAKGKSFSTAPPVKIRQKLSTLSKLKVADHVVLIYGHEETHGIVLNTQAEDNTFTLVEFTRGLSNDGSGSFYQNLSIQETKHVLGEDLNVSVVVYDKAEALSDIQVLNNARGFIASARYDDIGHGCESLARRCKTGRLELDSVDSSFKAFWRYSFWPFVSLLITWNPIYGVVFLLVTFSLASGHEVFKRFQDVYYKR